MRVVIIGNGVAGITAARHLRKLSDHEIVVVSDESDEFFSRTALMYIYMGHLRERDTRPYEPWFWEKNRIQRRRARVQRVDFQTKTIYTTAGETESYDALVIATGSRSNKFGWPGQDLDGVGGLYHLQDLAAMEIHSAAMCGTDVGARWTVDGSDTASPQIQQNTRPAKHAVIVGGGLIGIEMAEMFHSRGIPVTFLVRENSFWNNVLPAEESDMVNRHIREHGIDLRLGTGLREILDDGTGRCRAVVTDQGEEIACGFVGLTAGVSPNVDFLKNSGLELNRGVLVDDFLQTNQPDVYAVGDCAELRNPRPGRRAIEAVWYCGRMMGETLAHTLAGRSTVYDPGLWFNSAKFFEIEYQIYGDIPNVLPTGLSSLYWEHPGGHKSIRINYETATGRVTGFNLMGVRYRHEVCEQWLRTGASVEAVLPQLGLANFDPEFFPQHEHELVALYNRQTGKNLTLQRRRGLPAVLRFFKAGLSKEASTV